MLCVLLNVYVTAWEYLQVGHGYNCVGHVLLKHDNCYVCIDVYINCSYWGHLMVGHGYYRDRYASLSLVIVYKLFK